MCTERAPTPTAAFTLLEVMVALVIAFVGADWAVPGRERWTVRRRSRWRRARSVDKRDPAGGAAVLVEALKRLPSKIAMRLSGSRNSQISRLAETVGAAIALFTHLTDSGLDESMSRARPKPAIPA
jgi:hypothetical protein